MNLIPKFLMKNIYYIIILLVIIFILLAFQSFLDQAQEGIDGGSMPSTILKPITITYPLSSYDNPPPGYYRVGLSSMASFPLSGQASPLPDTSISGISIPNGFYIVDVNGVKMLAQVPYGYVANADKTDIVPVDTIIEAPSKNDDRANKDDSNIKKYDPTNYDVTYHDSIEDLKKQGSLGTGDGSAIVYDSKGNPISLPGINKPTTPTYYQPGSFIFGSTNYVPNYEDSVFLSRTTGLSQVAKNYSTASTSAGFCYKNRHFPSQLEQKCNALETDVCGSVSCCLSLGGQKCVSGDIHGPFMTANYTDPFIKNKDFYYYQGKCYGNCP
jgi:hypothetical protein